MQMSVDLQQLRRDHAVVFQRKLVLRIAAQAAMKEKLSAAEKDIFKRVELDRFSLNNLELSYLKASDNAACNPEYKHQSKRTAHELNVESLLNKHLSRKFFSSFWIGNTCCDFFIPGIYRPPGRLRYGSCGVIVEVDGSVHERIDKGKIDSWKEEYSLRLRIPIERILNNDSQSYRLIRTIDGLNKERVPHTRSKRFMWLRIYIETIAMHLSDGEFEERFDLNLWKMFGFKKHPLIERFIKADNLYVGYHKSGLEKGVDELTERLKRASSHSRT